jgi:hypothetical protein
LICKAEFNRDILALDEAGISQALAQSRGVLRSSGS